MMCTQVWNKAAWVGLICFCLLLTGVRASAQNATGEIDGQVMDSTGAAVPGATITVVNTDTHQLVRTLKTGGHGEYSVPLLPVGNYEVTVKAGKFAPQSSTATTVGVGDALRQDFQLAAEGIDVQLTVTANQVGPNLENAENSSTISNVQVNELALNTRNFVNLISLAPGVVFNGPDQLYPGMTTSTGAASPSNFAINGLQYSQITWLLDGTDILNHNGNNQTYVYPSVDAVNQIKIIRNGYGAEFGGAGSAQVAVVSKSGSAAFHGDLFFFFRNQLLNANSFFNKLATPALPRPTLRYNEYGGTIGGPVFLPGIYSRSSSRTFFFFSEEIRRIGNAPTQTFTNYPTLPQTQGYFLHPTAQTGTTAITNSPFSGYSYKVPAIDPTAQAYIKDIIGPALAIQQVNSPIDPQGVILQQRSTTAETQELVRLDHKFTDKLSLFIRFIYDPINLQIPNQYNGATNGFPGASNSNVNTFGKNVVAHLTYVPTSNLVIEAAYSYQPYGIVITPTGTLLSSKSPDVQVTLPYPSPVPRVPNLNINGSPAWVTRGPATDEDEAHQAFVNATLVRGRQNLLLGGNAEFTSRTANQAGVSVGQFAFTGAANKTTGLTAYEAAFSNFLAGKANTFTQSSVDPVSISQANLYEGYVQDNWRMTPHLTVNLGVRYSVYGQPVDALGHLGVFQPDFYQSSQAPVVNTTNGTICTKIVAGCSSINANYDPLNGIVVNNTAHSFGGSVSQTPYEDFAPRFGFAYDLDKKGTTALRGGYGIFFNQTQLNLAMTEVGANPAYIQNPAYPQPASFANPGAGVAATPATSTYGQIRNWKQPYTQAFNLDLQVQFPNSVMVDIGYVGNTTQHQILAEELNEPQPGYYHMASGVSAYPTSGTTTSAIDAYRPYVGYETIFNYSTRGFADYNGLQTSLNKRFGTRSLLSLNYTWSKSLSNVQTLFAAPQNTYDLKAEWGPSFQDRRNVFVGNFVYELPDLKGKNVVLREIAGGWETSGIVSVQSGQFGTVTQNSADPAGQGILAANSPAVARLDMNGNPNNGPKALSQFFNRSVFAQVPAGLYRPGNEKRNSVQGPGNQVWNLTLFRNFTLPRDMRLQFRLEAYNVFNHVNYDTVNTAFNNTAFGQVTAARDNRQLQLGAKYYF